MKRIKTIDTICFLVIFALILIITTAIQSAPVINTISDTRNNAKHLKLRWQISTKGVPLYENIFKYNDSIIFSTLDNITYSFSTLDSQEYWRYDHESFDIERSFIAQDSVFIQNGMQIKICDAITGGDLYYGINVTGEGWAPSSVSSNPNLLTNENNKPLFTYSASEMELMSFDALYKKEIWRKKLKYPIKSGFAEDELYLFYGDMAGYFYKLNKKNSEVIWQVKLKSAVTCDPILDKEGLIIGCSNGYINKLSTDDGKVIKEGKLNNSIIGAITTFNDYLILSTAQGTIYAVNKRNPDRIIWKFKCEGSLAFSGALVSGCYVVVDWNSNIYLLNASNGSLCSQTKIKGDISTNIAVGDDTIYFGTFQGFLYCYEVSSKKAQSVEKPVKSEIYTRSMVVSPYTDAFDYVWQLDTLGYSFEVKKEDDEIILGNSSSNIVYLDPDNQKILKTEIYDEHRLLTIYRRFTSDYFLRTSSSQISVYDRKDNKLKWSMKSKDYKFVTGSTIYKDTIYLGTDHKEIVGFDIHSGKQAYKLKLPILPVSNITISDKYLLVIDRDGRVYYYTKKTGSVKLLKDYKSFRLLDLALLDDYLLLREMDSGINKIDLRTEKHVWRINTDSTVMTLPVIKDDKIYFTTSDYLYINDYKTGKELKKYYLKNGSSGVLILKDDLFILGQKNDSLLAFKISASGETQ